jgi:membrane-bound metal-dependent hydrolase YbcI (DUF457 family)
MQMKTHVLFGLFFGTLLYYMRIIGVGLILLTGFAAILPDIDWVMQFVLGLRNLHRRFMHNVLALFVSAIIAYIALPSSITFAVVAFGFLSHLVTDFMTPGGVSWFYPFGRKFKPEGFIHIDEGERKFELALQSLLFGIIVLSLLSKYTGIRPITLEGIMTLMALIAFGYILMGVINRVIACMFKALLQRRGGLQRILGL